MQQSDDFKYIELGVRVAGSGGLVGKVVGTRSDSVGQGSGSIPRIAKFFFFFLENLKNILSFFT